MCKVYSKQDPLSSWFRKRAMKLDEKHPLERESQPKLTSSPSSFVKPTDQNPRNFRTDDKLAVDSMVESRTILPKGRSDKQEKASLAAMLSIVKSVRTRLTSESKQPLENNLLEALVSWLQVYLCYGFDYPCSKEHPRTVSKLIDSVTDAYQMARSCSEVSGWMSYFKYKNAAFFSAHNEQVIPEKPAGLASNDNPRCLFGGKFYKYLGVIRRSGLMRSFSTSILQSKKGMPRPSDEEVSEAERKSVLTMTTPKPQETWNYEWVRTISFDDSAYGKVQTAFQKQKHRNVGLYDPIPSWSQGFLTKDEEDCLMISHSIGLGREYMENHIKRTVRELFSDWKPDLVSLTEIFLPSTSSNYNRTRTKFGTFGELEDLDIFTMFRDNCGSIALEQFKCGLSDYVSEYYGEAGQQETYDYRGLLQECIGLNVEAKNFLQEWRKFYWRCVYYATLEQPYVEVVGLKEALKVRCISKGPPLTYFVLKPFQKSIWKHLQTKGTLFQYTGTPVTESLINEQFSKFVGTHRFHSGDYKGATDELHKWASKYCANCLFDVVERNLGFSMTVFRTLFIRALVYHIYVVVDAITRSTEYLKQARGQLMGSIVSFVILCVLNLVLIRAAYELAHEVSCSLKDLPSTLNGDDVVTAYTSERFPECWRGLGSILGFQESIGKTYDSKEFLSMNSTTFEVVGGRFKLVPYVNLGLVNCQGRSVTKGANAGEEENLLQLGAKHRELIDNCPAEAKTVAHKLFLHKHGDRLKTFRGSWFLPTWLGGLGLRNVAGYSKEDLSFAAAARKAIALGLEPCKPQAEKEWVFFDVFNAHMREQSVFYCKYPFEHYFGDETHGRAFTTIIWSLWLGQGISEFRKPEGETITIRSDTNEILKKVLLGAMSPQKELNKLLKFRDTVCILRKEGYFRDLKPMQPEEVEPEPKKTCIPLACF